MVKSKRRLASIPNLVKARLALSQYRRIADNPIINTADNPIITTAVNPIALVFQGKIGLYNLGNSCYLSSCLQCLSHIIPLTSYFLINEYVKEILDRDGTNGSLGLIIEYYDLLKIFCIDSTNTKAVYPISFMGKLKNLNPIYINVEQQQDAHELINYLIYKFHEDLNRVVDKPCYTAKFIGNGTDDEEISTNTWESDLLIENSIIKDILGGQLRSQLKCSFCKKVSVSFDYFQTIEITIQKTKLRSRKGSVDLEDCLELFIKEEKLDEANKMFCSKCNKKSNGIKKISFDKNKVPMVIILLLKRIENYETGEKIKTLVNFPLENLNINQYCGGESADGESLPMRYDLFAVSNHLGDNMNSGHYTACARNLWDNCESKWYEYNDDIVNEIDDGDVVTNNAYILFYKRQ